MGKGDIPIALMLYQNTVGTNCLGGEGGVKALSKFLDLIAFPLRMEVFYSGGRPTLKGIFFYLSAYLQRKGYISFNGARMLSRMLNRQVDLVKLVKRFNIKPEDIDLLFICAPIRVNYKSFPNAKLVYFCPEVIYPMTRSAFVTNTDLEAADYVFVQFRQFVNYFKQYNPHVYLSPNACNPEIFRPVRGLKLRYNVSFIGSVPRAPIERPKRFRYLQLIKGIPDCYIGSAWPLTRTVRIYSMSKIVLDICDFNQLTARPFEVLGVGRFLLTEDVPGLRECFQVGKHLAVYEPDDLLEKIGYYLSNAEEREKIAREGHKQCYKNHTIYHRARDMLSIIYGLSMLGEVASMYGFSDIDEYIQSLIPL